MKKNIKLAAIVTVFNTLKPAKLTKMEDADKYAIIKAMRSLKTEAEAFQSFLEDAKEKLKPENFEELQRKGAGFDSLSDEEKIAVNNAMMAYQAKVDECTRSEFLSEKEVELAPLSESAFNALVKSNDFTVSNIMTLQEVLC